MQDTDQDRRSNAVRFSAAERLVNLPAFGSLVAVKRIIPSTTSSYIAIDQHLLYDIMTPHLMCIKLDEGWYLDAYPDVRDAVERGLVANARHHYVRYGYYEHRLPFSVTVDEAWYLDAYRDVRDAIALGDIKSAQAHFVTRGFREGRLPYPNFRLVGDDAAVT